MKQSPTVLAAIAILASSAACAAPLTVELTNVTSARGSLLVAVCESASFLTRECRYMRKLPARTGTVVVAFADVAPGVYAVQAIHDENDNLEFDRNFLGIPTEPHGFSNNASASFGPPEFAAAAFEIANQQKTIRVRLRSLF